MTAPFAGHPALLHFRRRTGDVLSAVITDGMVETGGDPDPDLALDRLAGTLRKHANAPLEEILDTAFAQTSLDGAPRDGRSLLPVRMAASHALSCQPPLPLEAQQARWHHFLDELAYELARESDTHAPIVD
jgi:hypothetical protein